MFLNIFILNLLTTTLVTMMSPEDAITTLMEGNQRYMMNQSNTLNRSEERRLNLRKEQMPFAVIVSCADSRVAPEIIFDQGLGEIFVVRVAGNVVGDLELESINYALKNLGSSLVMILGHQNCGAVGAVLENNTADIKNIAKIIEPAVANNRGELKNAVKANAENVAKKLAKNPIVAPYVKTKQIKVVSGYYDFNTGQVQLLNNADGS